MCRKLIYLFLLMAVFAGSAHGQLISSVAHRNTDTDAPEPPEIAPNPLDEDELCFVDRDHQYNDIPAYLIGAEYVLTANDNKNVSSYELDVTLSDAATVYLFLDNRLQASGTGGGTGQGVNPDLGGMPWVTAMGFTDTGDDIGIDEGGDGDIDRWSSVFSLAVSAGTVTLGGCTEGHGGNMYGVAVTGPRVKARDPDPADGAIYADTWVSLGWTPGDTADSHDVYFGENFNDVEASTGGTFQGNQGDTYFFVGLGLSGDPYPGGLVPNTTYYWRIDEVEADGITKHTGNVWSFYIPFKKAYEPSPPDGAKFVDPSLTLSWTAGIGAKLHYVYFGEDFDTVINATDGTRTVSTSYSPEPLEYGKTYYWRVDETDGVTTHKGDVWSFTTVPDIPIEDPNLLCWWKFDEDAGTTAVDWSGHNHHGTLQGDPQWVEGIVGGALEFDGAGDRVIDDDAEEFLNGLSSFTVAMWIRSDLISTDRGFINTEPPDGGDNLITMRYDDAGANSGNDDCFKMAVTTPDGESQLESSANTQTTEWQHVAMTWSSGGLIRFYINGVEDTEADRNNPNNTGTVSSCNTLIIGAGAKDETTADEGWDGLIDDVRIYDKALTAEEIKEVMRGEPDLAWEPKPANGSTPNIDEAIPLSWSPGDFAAQHDVYFGTDKDAVADADTSTPNIYRGRQSGTSYTPTEDVEWGKTYYWRIDEYNTDGSVSKGRVWRFTVAEFIAIDDFEGYQGDLVPVTEQIWGIWRDGLGYGAEGVPPYYPGNGTGSEVGDGTTASYTEESIVNSGRQSMPYWYDNNKPDKAKYSEAKMTMIATRDWSKHGVKALSLWFRGYPASVGSFTESPAGTYTMTASGADIWNIGPGPGEYHDEFHFAYKMLTGAGTIISRVDSVQNTNGWAKAGVMIRNTLDSNSVHAMMVVTPAQGVSFQRRPGTGATSEHTTTGGITAPHWVRLERDLAGNFTAYHSTDGSTWEMQGTSQNIPMSANVYIGLALTAHNAAATCEAVFSNVTISGNVSAQWLHQDIGIQSNDAEPMYVALANKTGTPAVVYHDNPNAAQIDTWTEWNIDLKDFVDKGVVLTDVNSIAIGFGNRNNPVAGGAGKMYFDDIRLYRPRCLPNLIKPVGDFSNNCVVDMADLEIMSNDWLISGYDVTVLAASNANLEAHYKFEGNLLDSSGNLHHGDPCGTIAYAAGKIGQAIDFDGASYVNVASYQGVAGTQSRTISAWIKTTTTGEIVSWGQNVAGQKWIFRVQVDNGTEGAIRVEVNGGYIIGDTDVRDAQWHHVAAVLVDDGSPNATEMELYVDGILEVISASLDEPINTASDGVVRIGEAPWHNRPFTGQIDDVRIYGRVLSHGEIANLAGMSVGSVLQQPVLSLLSTTNDTDLHDDEKIDLKDFAVLADMWLEEQLWPEW